MLLFIQEFLSVHMVPYFLTVGTQRLPRLVGLTKSLEMMLVSSAASFLPLCSFRILFSGSIFFYMCRAAPIILILCIIFPVI